MGNAYSGIVLAQNVCTVSGTVHPAVHDLSRCGLTVCDVLTGAAEWNTCLGKGCGEVFVIRTSV